MNRAKHLLASTQRTRSRGFSLIELMVSVAIGMLLVAGAAFVYTQSRNTYAVNDTVARLQEQARYALSLIEPDVQLAGYYGFHNANLPEMFVVRVGAAAPISVVDARQVSAQVAGLPAAVHSCGRNFALDLTANVQGSNNAFVLGPVATAACNPLGGGARPNTDTLTIRRASTITAPANISAQRLQMFVNRFGLSGLSVLYNAAAPDPVLVGARELRDLIVRSYYVSRNSTGRIGFPALRVKRMPHPTALSPAFQDIELLPGVEDLQVQFGIDTGDYDNNGAVDPEADRNADGIPEGNGRVTRYVNSDWVDPGTGATLSTFQIVAVRLWVRIRADQPEQGFVDNRNYVYADVNYTPAGAEQRFRRVLVSKTILLRNARQS
jgi:type IV pilus assembly protein PilW